MSFFKKKRGVIVKPARKNPFVADPAQRRRQLHRRLGVACLVGVFGFCAYGVYGNVLHIRTINIASELSSDAQATIRDRVEQYLDEYKFGILPQRHFFVFNTHEVYERLEQQESLHRITITKDFPGTITVNAQEREVVLVWVVNNQSYGIDERGTVVKKIDAAQQEVNLVIAQDHATVVKRQESTSVTPIVYDSGSHDLNVGQQAVPPGMVQFIATAHDVFDAAAIPMSQYRVTNAYSDQITAKAVDGFYVYLKMGIDIEQQVKRLVAVISEKIPSPASISYIDLRFGETIYYQ